MTSPTEQPPAPSDTLSIADVVFTEATPHQRILSWTLNGASWAGNMTLDQHIGRETALSEAALSANGGTTYFILHPRDDPETIVSACEVTRKRACVLSGEDGGNQPREVTAYGIASVFTNPRFRGRGMASHMLRKVQEFVDNELKAEFGALYSDIGREYYTRLGWRDWRTPQLLLTLSEAKRDGGGGSSATLSANGSVPIYEEDVRKLAKEDIQRVKDSLIASAKRGNGGDKTRIAFLPHTEQFLWHFTRDRYMCKVLAGREVVNRGAKTPDSSAWVLWDHDLRERKLKVLRLVEDTAGTNSDDKRRADVKTLLRAAVAEAADWGLPKVSVWSPSGVTATAAADLWCELQPRVQVALEERMDGSIPSLRWKEDKPVDDVIWEANEYYAWC
ncbi:hypothetical protein VTJ49DRAFT_2545 [Mycothermus thermophilus]|uniref:LYC1 C-terminal domain-containing protein n=1 Tax=Humicola insolens TaxID=85995 RepID=A0ABR3VAG7_HUMIN